MTPASLKKQDVLMKEKSSYMDIYQKRPMRYRILETIVFIVVMVALAGFLPTGSGPYKISSVLSAVIIIGGAPFVYRGILAPEYMLTKNELIIRIQGKERIYSLQEVERASRWKAVFRLQGKKENLMVSRAFLDRLDDQLAKVQRNKKR